MKMSNYDEEELFERAGTAYRKAGGNMQPNKYESTVEEIDGVIYSVLRNVNGILAVYKYNPEKDRLTGLKEWPAALESN